MPYPPSHRIKVKERILAGARRLFNRRGFNAVSIDNVMAEAGLTRGSFYTYFDSKSALYAESVTSAVQPVKHAGGAGIGPSAPHLAARIARDCLSPRNGEDVAAGWPLIALPGDIGCADARVRAAFENALKPMVDIFEQALPRKGPPARERALAIAALCVGGMVLSRSIEDRALAEEVRNAALAAALSLGDWDQEDSAENAAPPPAGAFSGKVDTGFPLENATKQKF
jgi:TetR/AcrR family transcriptional regulator, transcriptional repressor for nem operon